MIDVIADHRFDRIAPIGFVIFAISVLRVGVQVQEIRADRTITILEPREYNAVLHLCHLGASFDRQRVSRSTAPGRIPSAPHSLANRARLKDVRCAAGSNDDRLGAEDIEVSRPYIEPNGPGDPAATGEYAVPMIQGIMASGTPIFGICLGHQILALAVGAKTYKMHMGHRGANQPVKDLETGQVEITSQNHGFCVDINSLPDDAMMTHTSLFDGTLEGIRIDGKPIFSVQYHPEASPGPHDSHYLFKRFVALMEG